MGWIYLAASVETPSLWHRGLEHEPIVRTIDSLSPYFCHACVMGPCHVLLSGTTSGHCTLLTLGRSKESTSSSEDSPAKTSALQAAAQAWRASAPDFSLRSRAWPKKRDHRFYSLKTFPPFEPEDFPPLLGHFPGSGMTVDGTLYPLTMWARRTGENDGSSLLPTPSACSYGTNLGGGAGRIGTARPSLETMARKNLWPTPTVHGNHNAPKDGTARGLGLSTAAKMWPTVKASDGHKGLRTPAGAAAELARGHGVDLTSAVTLEDGISGQLNPTWVEWLMGFPTGWTELNALGMQWCPRRRVKRSKD